MDDLVQRNTALQHEADIELARRSLSGCLMHFVLLLVIVFFTPYFHDHPKVIWTVGGVLFALGAERFWLASVFPINYWKDPAIWRMAFRGGTLAAAITWGAFCACTVKIYGTDWITWFVLLVTTGIAAGASASLSPDFGLYVIYSFMLLGPTALWGMVQGTFQERAMAVVVTLYLAYLLLQGREQTGAYWHAMHAGSMLKAKTAELEERSAYLKAMIEGSPLAIVVLGTDHRVQICNEAFEKMFLYSRQEAIGRPVDELLATEETLSEMTQLTRRAEAGNRIHEITVRKRKDGSTLDVELYGVPLSVDDKLVGLVGLYQDITYRKQAEEKLQEANQKLARWVKVLEKGSTEISLLSEMGNWLQSCQSTEEAYPIIGSTVQRLFPNYSGALCVMSASKNLLDTVCTWRDMSSAERVFAPPDCWALRRGKAYRSDGSGSTPACRHLHAAKRETFCLPLMAQGDALGILCLEASEAPADRDAPSSSLATEAQQRLASVLGEQIGLALANLKLRDTLRNQSVRDPLTGLFNRRYFEESLEREMSRATRNKSSMALLMLDIDHFKQFNDTFGHQAGDTLLREVGELLKTGTRGQDVACRYGGEEFAIILSDAEPGGAVQRAEKLRQQVKQMNVQHAGQVLGIVSVSIGVAMYPMHGPGIEDMIRFADEALYRSKSEGRDRVMIAPSLVAK
jgi:diguanylate cyclase (GGDEF)-like protein/PAS domain S-box-containing protein